VIHDALYIVCEAVCIALAFEGVDWLKKRLR